MKENVKNYLLDLANCIVLLLIAIVVYKLTGIVKNETFQLTATIALTAYAAAIQKKRY